MKTETHLQYYISVELDYVIWFEAKKKYTCIKFITSLVSSIKFILTNVSHTS